MLTLLFFLMKWFKEMVKFPIMCLADGSCAFTFGYKGHFKANVLQKANVLHFLGNISFLEDT